MYGGDEIGLGDGNAPWAFLASVALTLFRTSHMAPPKPGPPSAGGSKFSNKGQSTGTTGARLWEKKPSSFKGPSKHGGAPGGPRSFKSGPSEGGKYVIYA